MNKKEPPRLSLLARARPLVIARALAAGLSFVIPLALARAFPPDEYGTYKLLILVAQTLYYVLPFGMTQSLYYFLPRFSERRAILVQTLFFLTGVGILAFILIMQLRVELGVLLNNPEFGRYAWPLGIYVFGLIGSTPLEVSQTARGKVKSAAFLYVFFDGVKALAMTVPALLGWGLKGVMIGIAFFAMARLVMTWVMLLRGERGAVWDKQGLREQLRYALPFGAAIAIAIPQQYFHQFVVSSRMDAATFALYAVGIFQLPIIDLLYTPTTEILMVRIAELEREGRIDLAANVFREAVARLSQVFVPISFFLAAVAPEFITVLFTDRYIGSAPIFRLVALGGLLACFPVDGVLRARKETKHIFKSYLWKAVITVPLVMAGITYFGMIGAATAWLVAEISGKVLLFKQIPRIFRVTFRELIPVRELVRCLVVSLVAMGGVWGIQMGLQSIPVVTIRLMLAAVAYVSVYCLGYGLTGGGLPFWRAVKTQAKTSST